MAAFDIVGIDFELGLGVDCRARAQHQVTAELMGVDLLRAGTHRNAALKGAVGPPRGYPSEDFAGLAARRHMIHCRQNVGLLTARQQKGAVEIATPPFPLVAYRRLVPHPPAPPQYAK